MIKCMSSETSPDPLQRLRTGPTTLRAAKRERAEAIAAARKVGHSWAVIGAALGITDQAAAHFSRRRAPRQ